jgi:L,D-transpeptidase YcbB
MQFYPRALTVQHATRLLAFVCALVVAEILSSAIVIGSFAFAASRSDEFSTIAAIRDRLALESEDVVSFYEARNLEPAWTGSARAERRGERLRAALENAGEHGLNPVDYVTEWRMRQGMTDESLGAVSYDISLTKTALRYVRDLRLGRLKPRDVHKDVDLPQPSFDAADALQDAFGRRSLDAFLASLPPPHPAYHALAEALSRYRLIADRGGWPLVPKTVKLEDGNAGLRILAERLAFEDPILASASHSSAANLRDAVVRFQLRHDLTDDGTLGPETLKAMNVTAEYRAKQIAANMERVRWLPRKLERRYIVVNVPGQNLAYIRDGESILRSAVVIGKKSTPTPIMRMEVKTVVSNPVWTIPPDMAARMNRNAGALAKRGIIVVQGSLQQKPGPGNPLGELMLNSPNDFGVYMHDTPNKKLFLSTMRERSNGCIRVQEIFQLASLALADDPNAASSVLTQATSSGMTVDLPLREPLPVYVLYWTAMPLEGGMVQFFPDRYGRDRALIAALEGGRQPRGPRSDKTAAAAP